MKSNEFEKIELAFCKKKFGVDFALTVYDKETLQELAEFFYKAKTIEDNEILKSALQTAIATIRAYHGLSIINERIEKRLWDLYQNSPEMKLINKAKKLLEQ